MSTLSIALTGNPNAGKSTIFNQLTGAKQKIGNWPGVTVDKKVGYLNYKDRAISIVDLPGTYSIHARSPEEKIVTDYLQHSTPDIIVDVVDASNIERNLFLTLQLLEMRIPVLIDLNMMDEAKRRGININVEKLERMIGMPVVQTVGRSHSSVKKLLDVFTTKTMKDYSLSERLEEHIAKVEMIKQQSKAESAIEEELITLRYALIDEIMKEAVVVDGVSPSLSEKLDSFLANGFLALPLLLAFLYLMFEITFTWIGQPLADMIDEFIAGTFTEMVAESLVAANVEDWVQSLVLDGIVAGVGAVLTFVPLIFTLFFCLSFLDGTGYMARVAFIMDPIMRRAGLSGKGIMPLIMGFGCAVPAIMGARTLDSEKDRMTAILVTPFLTCGAKLPIMALFAALFFPDNAANVVFLMYISGVVMAIVAAKLLGSTVFKDKGSTFLLELPPYRIPDMRSVLIETWDKGKGYLVKAGTIIFAMSVAIWFLSNFNSSGMVEDMDDSYLATAGSAVGSLFVFHGFDTWEAGASVITGVLAKEAVVSTMGVLYGAPDISAEAEDAIESAVALAEAGMKASFTALSALTFMVFAQLYTPCVTALGTVKKEAGAWKWMAFSAGYMFALAWVVSLIIYQGGRLLGFE